MASLFTTILSGIITGILSIWEGFVLMKLWGWFIVPTFGLPVLTIPVAIGMVMIVTFLAHQMRTDSEDIDPIQHAIRLFSYGFVNAGVILLIGYIVTFFL